MSGRMFIFFFMFLFSVEPCLAQTVDLKWKEVRGAEKYEIHVLQQDKVILKKVTSSAVLKRAFQFIPGYYYFRVRGIDGRRKPGKWSKDSPLVVNPPGVTPVGPKPGSQIFFGEENKKFKAAWKPSEGAHKYLLEVRSDKKMVYTELVGTNEVEFRFLPPGPYKWRVKALIEAMGAIPEAMESRIGGFSAGEPSDWVPFTVKAIPIPQEGLVGPLILFPKGHVLPPGNSGKLTFDWEPVPGATAYEVVLEGMSREPASSQSRAIKKFSSNESKLDIDLPKEGTFSWTVRAVAGIDSNGSPKKLGPRSMAEFELDANAEPLSPIDLNIFLSLTPYSLRVVSPYASVSESTSAMAFSLVADLNYRFSRFFEVKGFVDGTFYKLNDLTVDRKEAGVLFSLRKHLGGVDKGWMFYARAGPVFQESFSIIPDGRSQDIDRFANLGSYLGIELYKEFSQKFLLGFRINSLYPLLVISQPSRDSVLSGRGRDSNYFAGIESKIRFSPLFGLVLGAGYSQRILVYVKDPAGSFEEEQSRIHSLHAYVGFALAWGK